MGAVLSVAEMYRADAFAIENGIPGRELMENAGRAVAEAVRERFGRRDCLVLCGPGNNGGDGFVAARHLEQAGMPVRLALLGSPERLEGDAAWAAGTWSGAVQALDAQTDLPGEDGLVLDALFGAGLARPLEGAPAELLRRIAASGLPAVAVDVPSGLDGDSGQVRGMALPAVMTVSFFRPKPAHLLFPGRGLCGETRIVDIGIPEAALSAIAPRTATNEVALWRVHWPEPRAEGHKYSRGHVLVAGGPRGRTGASRLAARGALRIGAGLVTLAVPSAAVAECAAQLTAVMIDAYQGAAGFRRCLGDSRRNALVLGPGNGLGPTTRANVRAALETGRACVLDADALTVFARRPAELFAALHENCVLTPHEGEFARLFDSPAADGKLARARAAARQCGAQVLLKGADTVVAAPDGRAAIMADAPATLATAGSGDVLAGFIGGLLAQGMPAFEAACAAVWLHAEAARLFGPGLIAEDLPEALPRALAALPRTDA